MQRKIWVNIIISSAGTLSQTGRSLKYPEMDSNILYGPVRNKLPSTKSLGILKHFRSFSQHL